MLDHDAQADEMLALESIFDSSEFSSQEINSEFSGKFNAHITLPEEFKVVYQMLPLNWRFGKRPDEIENLGPPEQLVVKFLPPLELSFTLPPDYPSTSPPRFTLTSCWLDRKQLSKLCVKLDSLWEENKGLEILYLWMSFLKEDSYSSLGLGPTLSLSKLYTRNINLINQRKRQIMRQECKDSSNGIKDSAGSSGQTIQRVNHNNFGVKDGVPDKRHSMVGASAWKGAPKARCEEPNAVPVLYNKHHVLAPSSSNKLGKETANPEGYSKFHGYPSDPRTRDSENFRNKPKYYRRRENRKFVDSLDHRAVASIPSATLLIELLEEHDKLMKNKEFERNIFTCKICFDDKPGGQCVEFNGCGHVFCRECVAGYFEVQIQEGNVHSMLCLEEGCTSEALQKQVREAVGPELFAKYDTLLLSSTLDMMEDIVYCPRKSCNYPVTREVNDDMALCPFCQYSFCVYCKMGYHGVEPCRIKSEKKLELLTKYESASESEKAQLEAQYGRKRLREWCNTSRSEEWIYYNSKSCPHCLAPIEKSNGCNKMVCWRCGTNFCWICSIQLDSKIAYVHFNSSTSPCFNMLFHGILIEEEEEEDEDIEIFDDDEVL